MPHTFGCPIYLAAPCMFECHLYIWTPPYVLMPHVWMPPYFWTPHMFGCPHCMFGHPPYVLMPPLYVWTPCMFGHPHMFGCPHMFGDPTYVLMPPICLDDKACFLSVVCSTADVWRPPTYVWTPPCMFG